MPDTSGCPSMAEASPGWLAAAAARVSLRPDSGIFLGWIGRLKRLRDTLLHQSENMSTAYSSQTLDRIRTTDT